MKEENVVYDNTKKSKKNILLILAIVIVTIGIGLAGVGMFLLSKPKAVFQESYNYLTKGFKNLELDNYKKVDFSDKDKLKVDSKINVNLDQSLGLGVNSIDLNLQMLEDKTNKTSKVYLDSKLENQKLLEFISYLKDDKIYLTITDIFDKYYYTDLDYSSISENMSQEDIELLMDIVEDSFKKVITDEKFEKEKTTTSVDGIEESVTKLTLKVDDKLLSELFTEVINGIKNNEDAVNFLVKISQTTKEELVSSLDETLEELKKTTGETLFTYNIYYKNINDIKKLEILSGTSVITYTANDKDCRLKYVENNVEELTVVVAEKDNDFDITINTRSLNVNGKLIKNKNSYNLTLNMVDSSNNKLGTLVIDYVYTSNVQDKLVVVYQMDGVDMVKVTVDSKITFDEAVILPDLSTSKSIDSMTEEEANAIMINLQNHQIIGPIISMFFPTEDDSLLDDGSYDIYDDNYDYDNNYEFDIYQ